MYFYFNLQTYFILTPFQNLPAPPLDSIPVPQFESERNIPVTPKSSANPLNAASFSSASKQAALESGTSVAPRQRPKANSSSQNAATGALGNTLPIMLPPSPSPRTVLSSPVPTSVVVLNQQPSASIVSSMGPPAVPPIAQAVVPEGAQGDVDFNAQFTAVFPPTTTSTTTPVGIITTNNNIDECAGSQKHLNNLFETNYPDPFREQQQRQLQQLNTLGDGPGLNDVAMSFSGSANVLVGGTGGGGSGAGTPTKGPLNSLAAHHQHRRNVSDTSAFNK